eukprot:SAG31_NODE_37444_length_304_cov_0.760976_1_plen_79_part_10
MVALFYLMLATFLCRLHFPHLFLGLLKTLDTTTLSLFTVNPLLSCLFFQSPFFLCNSTGFPLCALCLCSLALLCCALLS